VNITVVNDSSETLTDVTLKYRKQRNDVDEALGTLKKRETRGARIECDNETYLYLAFQDVHGAQHKELIDVYFDDGHSPLTLRVAADYTVRCEGCNRR
jgi:hypothetical protein